MFWRALDTLWAATGNCKPLAVENFCDVKVEKVHVQDGLDAAGDDGDLVDKVLVSEAPVPVNNVQSSVSSLEKQVVAGDGLGLASLGDHLQLRHDGHRFEVDRKSPQELGDVEIVVDEEGHADGWDENELDSEFVAFFVVSRAEFRIDEEAGHEGAEQVGDLHEGIVRTDEDGEEIQVTSNENKEEQHLRFTRNARDWSWLPDLGEQDQHGEEMRQVAA